MTNAIIHGSPNYDVAKIGSALYKTGKFGILYECELKLRGFFAPFRLEIYTTSSSGKVYSLKDVKRVKFCGSFARDVHLKIQFSGSVSLYFTFPTEKEASEWMEGIQMHSLAVPKQILWTDHKFPVFLMPNSYCHWNGRHHLFVTDDSIRICDECDMTPRIVWPVHTIRFYGNKGPHFIVATTSRSETGDGVFRFDAMCAKKAALIYSCVAASVTHGFQVASSCSSVPLRRPRLPCHAVPDSRPTYYTSVLSDTSATDGLSNDDYSHCISAANRFASPDLKEAFLWNSFYLKQIGLSVMKPTKMPEIYGLSEPKRELLDVLSAEMDMLERFAFSAVLYGPSNCGKQLLVEAAAFSCGASLICITSHCLLQLDRQRRDGIQVMFDIALALAPCIVLFKQLQHVLPASSASESDHTCRVLQTVKDAFGMQSRMKVAVVGTISDLSAVDDPLLAICSMARKIYVPPPCLESRHQVFAKELQSLLSSPEGGNCVAVLAQSTAGFDFVQLADLYRDLKKMAASDALDREMQRGRCRMMIDLKKVKKVLKQNVSSERKAYEESGLGSARYYALLHSQESALFVVKLMANEALYGISHCFLRISDSSIDLLDLDPTHTIMSWQFKMIRWFTWTPLSFVLEVGRMTPTDAGEVHFETIAAKTISDRLSKTLLMKKIHLDSAR